MLKLIIQKGDIMQNSISKSPRRYEYDAMREIIVASVCFFHTSRIFDDLGNFYVKNDTVIPAASFFNMISIQIGMPILFVIAGFSMWSSLQKRTPTRFIIERFRRLIIPFIFGILVVAPPQKYFQMFQNPAYDETYRSFYFRFFDFTIAWFLYDLFAFTVILLPLFLYFQSNAGKKHLEIISNFWSVPYSAFLFTVPIALIEAVFKTNFSGGWGKSTYIPFIICGYLIGADSRFKKALYRHRKAALIFGIMTFAVGSDLYIKLSNDLSIDPLTAYDSASLFFRAIKGASGWFLSASILGFLESIPIKRELGPSGKRHFGAAIEQYANGAVLPFYLLHEVAVVAIGFYVVQWHICATLKFLIIGLSSFTATLLAYEVLIRRIKIMRLLFGMKPDIG